MRVLHVASECYPLLKTGGLADVVAALPTALAGLGVDARILLPGHPQVLDGLVDPQPVRSFPNPWTTEPARLIHGRTPDGVRCYAVDAPGLLDRPGNPYVDPNGLDWPDNHRRYALLGWAAAWMAGPGDGWRWRPDIVHAHDWQAGLAPAYLVLSGGPRPRTVITIHNIAFQGIFPPTLLGDIALPPESFSMHGVEFHGQISYLKAGLWYSDRITTVSPTYAQEIQTPGGGWGLEGLLAARSADLWGILNGVDYAVWNPATDPHLAARYDARNLAGKAQCKAALQAKLGLEQRADAPLFGVVSRLTAAKGFDLLLHAAGRLIERGGQLAVLGSGETWLEDGFIDLAGHFPGRAATVIGYNEGLSHRIQGGADSVVMPSRTEPCGLVQLYGLRYGTLPVVRRTGGLADTVVHADDPAIAEGRATGFAFDDADIGGLNWAVDRALQLYREPEAWARVQRTAMAQDFSWTASARRYLDLYQSLYSDI